MAFRAPPLLVGLIALLTAIEVALWMADAGFLGAGFRNLRMEAYAYGGFWPGLLRDWRPNFALQPVTMFVTYAFLHAGPAHLAMNMITLLALGRAVIERAGTRSFASIYGASILGGAAGYGLLAAGYQPMVGASGALFGLAGAIVCWAYLDRRRLHLGPGPVLRALMLLVGVNVVMYWALDGRLAWQTHLGGAVVGIAVAWTIDRRSARLRVSPWGDDR